MKADKIIVYYLQSKIRNHFYANKTEFFTIYKHSPEHLSHLLKVNLLTQPEVELVKKETFKILIRVAKTRQPC